MYVLPSMSHHPDEPLIEIVGIEAASSGRSCEQHSVCGTVLAIDTVVRFRFINVINGKSLNNLYCFHFVHLRLTHARN